MNSRYFTFNDEKSIDKGYHIIYFDEEYFNKLTYGGRSIEVTELGTPMFDDETFEISFIVAKMNVKGELTPFGMHDINELGRWLIHDEFKPLIFSDNPTKIYYVALEEMSPLQLDRQENGFIELTFRGSSNHAYTTPRTTMQEVYGETRMEVFGENVLQDKYYPYIRFKALKRGDVEFYNRSTGQKVVIEDVLADEVITIDNEYRIIETNIHNRNIFKHFNREWLYLRYGSNFLEIKGHIQLFMQSQFPIL